MWILQEFITTKFILIFSLSVLSKNKTIFIMTCCMIKRLENIANLEI